MEQAKPISIYVIQNITSLDVYVGQTVRPGKRWTNHLYAARHLTSNARHVHRMMHKLGVENFRFTVIETHTTQHDADEAESFWIEFFRANVDGYNVANGGTDKRTAYKGKHFSPSSEFKPGHVMSAATCAKLSEAAKGRCARPPSRLGSTCSAEMRAHLAKLNARLAPEDISCIRESVQNGCSRSELAKRYGVGTTTISNIVSGKSYRHVPSTVHSAA